MYEGRGYKLKRGMDYVSVIGYDMIYKYGQLYILLFFILVSCIFIIQISVLFCFDCYIDYGDCDCQSTILVLLKYFDIIIIFKWIDYKIIMISKYFNNIRIW